MKNAKSLEEDNIFTGKNTQPDAFFAANNIAVKDITPDGFGVPDVLNVIENDFYMSKKISINQ